jgi:5-methylcytosine-specific restriction protein A
MPLIYYWRGDNYRRDLDYGAGYHLNQASPVMHSIDIGDSLWAFTRAAGGRYVLAAELVVRAKTLNPPGFRYGRFRVWGDLSRSRYFRADDAPSADQLIRSLSCRADAEILGRSFQGHAAVRLLTGHDHLVLASAARTLPLEPRARILPEERLEASLLLGDSAAVETLISEERAGVAEQRAVYLFTQAPARNRDLVRLLQEMYRGRCQICLWSPKDEYGQWLCQGHHLQWLSRGGADVIENMALVCPNHHSAIHACDAPLDYSDMAFDFHTHREPIRACSHLPR